MNDNGFETCSNASPSVFRSVEIEIFPGGRLPAKAHASDAAWDCFARSVDVDLDRGLVRCALGFRLGLPPGWFADLRPRSSIFKTGLVLSNSCGVVDAGYRGEVMAIFYGGKTAACAPYHVGDRVVQMLLRRLNYTKLVQVESVDKNTARGEGGFGSTGT